MTNTDGGAGSVEAPTAWANGLATTLTATTNASNPAHRTMRMAHLLWSRPILPGPHAAR